MISKQKLSSSVHLQCMVKHNSYCYQDLSQQLKGIFVLGLVQDLTTFDISSRQGLER